MTPELISAIASCVSTLVVGFTAVYIVKQLREKKHARYGQTVQWFFALFGTPGGRASSRLVIN
jgi:hypothetical protein